MKLTRRLRLIRIVQGVPKKVLLRPRIPNYDLVLRGHGYVLGALDPAQKKMISRHRLVCLRGVPDTGN